MSRRVEVVGSGMVGARLCDEVRRRDPDGRRVRLTVLGAEPRPAYTRVLLSTVLAGGPAARSTTPYTNGWAARRRIDLRTGVAAVDCARPAGCVSGVVQPGWEQAAVLADLLTGADPAARHRGTRTGTRLEARDVDLATVSDPALLDAPDVVRFLDSVGGCDAAPAFVDERVVAGAMVGLPNVAASMIQFCDGAIPVASDDRLALLLGRALPGSAETADPGRSPNAAVVCRCNIVTEGVLVAAWRDGATDPGALARVTTGWGSCGDPVRGISAWRAESDPSTEEAA